MPNPTLDFQEFKQSGHELIDWIAGYLSGIEEVRLFPKTDPAALQKLFEEPLPLTGISLQKIIGDLNQKLIPNCCHVSHPGYFGFITPTPLPVGILADALCSALNQNVGTYSVGPGAVALEKQTVRWLADLSGFGENAGGHLTSGGTLANFEGMKLARDWASGDKAQHEGVNVHMSAYVSEERHISLDKAADAIGIGRNNLRHIPTDDQFRVQLDLLEASINTDREKGIKPFCLIGLAGTTNTGAIDDLPELRKIADREKLWFHIDAAYGGGLLLSRKWKNLLRGIETADSVTIDPHKWFFAPLDAGAILVKDQSRLGESYGMQPPYLKDETDTENKRFQYYANSFEQSRRFRSLKVWMSFKHYGAEQIGEWVDNNVEQAQQLHRLCQKRPDFISAAEPQMSGVCIRYQPGDMEQDRLDKLHVEVSRIIEETGKFWITTTRLKNKTWFRINIVNFRTRLEHMQALLSHLEETCLKVHQSYKK